MKVGQKVKIIKNSYASWNRIGDVGIIIEVNKNDDAAKVQVNENDSFHYWMKISTDLKKTR